jgi:hypothetical protein
MPEHLSRRTLLLGGSALAVMAACGKNGDDINVADTSTTKGQDDVLSTVMAGSMFQTGIEERITFALFQGVPATLVPAGAVVHVAFQKPGTKALTEAIPAVRKSEGITERPYYVVHHEFDVAGDWGLRATVVGKKPGDAVITINDPDAVAWPTPGDALPKVKTPTTTDALGVDPICTRSEGTCPFHERSLDTLVGNGKPTIVMLSTPALCQSAVCGPVLDILLTETEANRERANIVHVEVFADATGKTLSPAFAAFKTQSEPVLYLADRRGTITERFNGPFDQSEAREAIARLLG